MILIALWMMLLKCMGIQNMMISMKSVEEHENLSTMEVDQEEVVSKPLLEELHDEATNEEPDLELDAEKVELAEEIEWDLFQENQDEDEFGNFANDNAHRVDSVEDIAMIDFFELDTEDLLKFQFANVDCAYEFYNTYAKHHGSSARKSKIRKSQNGLLYLKEFVCFRQGFRHRKHYNKMNRKREAKPETRFGCNTHFVVRFVHETGRFHISLFSDYHNHELLDPRFFGLLPKHRKMNDAEVGQMNNMRMAGIGPSQIYSLMAGEAGGFRSISFFRRDMYNQIAKQRRSLPCDADTAMKYLKDMAAKDPMLYYNREKDSDGVFSRLFWSDGMSQLDYMLFGDVIAFDATYKKIRYDLPLVVLSGVNHNNQSVVFGAALVADEKDENYVWILENFVTATKGKPPVSIITDGDRVMKRAIGIVFPNAHHRLCAWHLIRNATSNIGNPRFTKQFKSCMLGDYEIDAFRRK